MIFWLKKIYCHLKRQVKKQAGLSLMEIVVVMAVFSTMSLLVTDVFLAVSRSQIQTSSTQKVQSDARFAMEAIAREIKFGTIDYQCYADYINSSGCDDLGLVGAISDLESSVPILVTRDQENNQIFYAFTDQKIRACSNTRIDPGRCYCTEISCEGNFYRNWQDVTPKDVKVVDLDFYISPAFSPFSKKVYCEKEEDCDLLNTCGEVETNKCDIPDIQPRVTIVMSTRSTEEGARGEQIILQTSVSTMRYLR